MHADRFFGRAGLVLLAVALLLLVIAFYLGANAMNTLSRSVVATGIVVAVEQAAGYVPVVEFTDQSGRPTQFHNPYSFRTQQYAVGDEVAIIYDPVRPEQAQIYSFWMLWLLPLVSGFIGLCALAVASGFLIVTRSSGGSYAEAAALHELREQARKTAERRPPVALDPATLARIEDALRRGRKIEAIKLYRRATGVGLKEAKDQVEALDARR
jgi:hypothetical protein